MIERVEALGCEDTMAKLALIEEAKRISGRLKWNPGIFQSNRALASAYINCFHRYDKVFDILQESVELAHKSGDVTNEANALQSIAKNYSRIHQHDRAIDFFGQALLTRPGADATSGILAEMGNEYSLINDYPNTITYYDSSLKTMELEIKRRKKSNLSDTELQIGIKLNMAVIYLSMPDEQKALANYEEVLAISNQIKNKRFTIISLTGIGKTLHQLRRYSNAISYFQKALDECSGISRFGDEVIVLNELANTYLDSGSLQKAKEYAENALSLAEVQQVSKQLSKTNATLGNVYLKLNRPDLAIFYLQRALDLSVQTHVLADQKVAWLGLDSAYKKSGRYDKALNAFEHFVAARDSAGNIEKTNEAIRRDLDIKYKTEETKAEDEYNRKLERVNLVTYVGFGGLVLVLSLAFFMYRNYKTQKKYNALLSKEKKSHLAHIAAQSHVLSDIAHIQAHDVRGPVSAILGFIQIYNYEDLSDPENLEIIKWIGESAGKLDSVVRNVVSKENDLRSEHEPDEEPVS